MSLMDRLRGLFSRTPATPLAVDAPGLVAVASCSDPALAPSSVLAAAADWDQTGQAVLRHRLRLPADKAAEAADLIRQDGYDLREADPAEDGLAGFHALRPGVVTALEVAREQSRMASLAQRLGGAAAGWDVLQPRGRETDNIGTRQT